MSESNQSYISKVHLKGYKSIKDLEVELKPGLNIIIGPNGSGKTNFLEFLKIIKEITIEYNINSISKLRVAFESLIYLNNNVFPETIIYSELKNINNSVLQVIKEEYYDSSMNSLEKYECILDFRRKKIVEATSKNYFTDLKSRILLRDLDSISYLNLVDLMTSEDYITIYSSEGYSDEILGPFLENHYEKELKGLGQLVGGLWIDFHIGNISENLRGKISFFKNSLKNITIIESIKIDTNKLTQDYGADDENNKSHWVEIKNILNSLQFQIHGDWYSWNELSDGTKRIFYILIEVSFSSNLILIEEPELGIHPNQLKQLMKFLEEQAKEKQIIITTHSPQVLNIFNENKLDNIIMTRYNSERGTTMHHLTKEQKQLVSNYIEEGLSLGDAWVYSTRFEQTEEETL